MGKNLIVIGDLGLVRVSYKENYNFNKLVTKWRVFPVLEFPELLNIMERKMNFEDDLNWYLLTAPWEFNEYSYLKLPVNFRNYVEWSYKRNRTMFFKSYKEKEDYFRKLNGMHEDKERELIGAVCSKMNSDPDILIQEWFVDKKIDFDCLGELGEILYITAINKSNFSPRIYEINDGNDFNLEFYKVDNNNKRGVLDKIGLLLGNEEKKVLEFSFRYSELKKIQTIDGINFRIITKVGEFSI